MYLQNSCHYQRHVTLYTVALKQSDEFTNKIINRVLHLCIFAQQTFFHVLFLYRYFFFVSWLSCLILISVAWHSLRNLSFRNTSCVCYVFPCTLICITFMTLTIFFCQLFVYFIAFHCVCVSIRFLYFRHMLYFIKTLFLVATNVHTYYIAFK